MHPPQPSALLYGLLLGPLQAAALLDCKKVRVDGHNFDISALGGPHSVVTSRFEPSTNAHQNTTYTVDVCQPLKKSGKGKGKEDCPNGTRVCAIERFIKGDQDFVEKVVAIAGGLENAGGSQFEYEAVRLSTSDSNADSKKEGLRLVFKGGKHPLTGPPSEQREQRAVIEFLCDPDKKGTEGEWESEDKYEKSSAEKADGGKGGDGDDEEGDSSIEHQLKLDGAALIWESYGKEDDADVLRLTWHTQHACEKRDGGKDGSSGGGEEGGDASSNWGFFTWFIILLFLGTAAYLIFGSWLNYNRYGARGWDLVPHGDAIRDIPYLMKDWTRRVLNTVQGTGSRGGYSAV
ncbi:Autophagy-related protein 27 [Escovopsis weberi]|uniref:Autophagy-related protein 27 n=1 Tax=Escovopsis weberi TaxID=150374 RepID=A0A0M8N8V8_ESCWE|nr:Autophagy-related protein 27 [Escovopsis weberi]